MPIPSRLLERIATFRAHLDSYLSPDYKEARLREEFLNPLFEELGWDIANRHGYAEAYKDVVHEDALKISGVGTVAPDFSFRIGGNRKFFVEAKKPSVRVKDDPEPAAQLRRYSFTAGLPLGIVTDFHEFAIYDGRVRWRAGDKASTARLFYCTFEELPEHWDFIAGIFSRDAVLRGGFDKYAATTKGKRGTSEFDDEFLKDMEHWRELLARNIALRNTVAQRDLNFAVQRILDRIIFLRIAEDRGIERFGQLQALTAGPRLYPRFCDLCRHADLRYNSGLFHFEPEKGRDESPDRLTLDLEIDDAVLKEILAALYYPRSPYAFAVVPADVLGHVYEQFLGKVIHLTSEHRVKVEEKPEVRKAGGVYYTPTYIVSYIVAQTLGPLLDGRTPKQAEKLRVLDPACGSGSFLLGAFDYLLDWHLKYYLAHDPESWAKKKNPPIYETAPNADRSISGALSSPPAALSSSRNWQLTTAERKRILLNNLHGVDIDAQAVEVTKLSLLLKVLEGQARELQGKQLDFHRVLPDLGKNIKCGNSLIGSDFYAQENLPTLDDEARLQINAFDWPHEFADIMTAGGFDAVIGNPPYVRIQALQETQPEAAKFYSVHFRAAAAGNFDLYVCFLEKGLSLLSRDGRLGFIVPHKFFNAEYGEALRDLIATGRHLASTVHFGHQQVFKGATTYTTILGLTKTANESVQFAAVNDIEAWRASPQSLPVRTVRPPLGAAPWNFAAEGAERLRTKLASAGKPLGTVARIFQGLVTGADDIFVIKSAGSLEKKLLKPFLTTGSLAAYVPAKPTACMIFPYEISDDGAELLAASAIKTSAPNVWEHLLAHRDRLRERERGKWHHDRWYAFGRSQNLTQMRAPKLIVQVTALRPTVILDEQGLHMTGGGSGPFYGVRPVDDTVSLRYLLGILNSRLFGWFVRGQSTVLRGGYIKFSKQYIETTPIVTTPGKKLHDALVAHVERMLKLHEQLAAAKSPHEQTHLQRDIAATDRAIDQLVYQLYGLTPEEIALVEAATAPAAAKPAAEADETPALPAPVPGGGYESHFLAKEDPPADSP